MLNKVAAPCTLKIESAFRLPSVYYPGGSVPGHCGNRMRKKKGNDAGKRQSNEGIEKKKKERIGVRDFFAVVL